MIKDIFIKGFESYKNKTHLRLHKNVNVVMGVSDSGKSAIVRSEVLINQNSPLGEAYKNDELDKKDSVEISNIYTDGQKVSIIRKNSKTNYKINNEKEPFNALKGTVPKEVQEITKMKSINIQGQHPTEQYFLLTESPGQVAKKFNEVVGISIMDRALTKTKSLKRETNSELKVIAKEIENTHSFIKSHKWVEQALKKAKKLKAIFSESESLREKRTKLFGLVGKIVLHDNWIKRDYHSIPEAFAELKKLEKLESRIINLKNKKQDLENAIIRIDKLDLQISADKDIDKALKQLNKLIKLQNELNGSYRMYRKFSNLVSAIETSDKLIEKETEKIKKTEQQFNKLLKTEECPVCGRKG